MNLKVGDRILEWLSLVGDPNRDPWQDSVDSLISEMPVGKDPVIADPTFDFTDISDELDEVSSCLLYTSPSPRDRQKSRMPSSA